MSIRRQPDPMPPGPNFGVINTGQMSGPVQAAPFSHNATQTNNITPSAIEHARDSVQDLRVRLEQLRGQHPDADRALRALDGISELLDAPERAPGALRDATDSLLERCGGIPSVLTAAQLVHSAVMALLPV
ncbi:hypothetical protein LO772_15495 [Yinghuangia sp. ASG 101]|uniref:hypothetical protein n=1 Tax=Yinghuangia sp. ASG 101 TaxID=2896848 RepID=UPI001E644D43|nr:hypothetical protein [Yinghuangia sp. ASG 101]UGQ14847.1 hypothetical protein LO772_15495 [Yinghuangia sp. ASG 101]